MYKYMGIDISKKIQSDSPSSILTGTIKLNCSQNEAVDDVDMQKVQ